MVECIQFSYDLFLFQIWNVADGSSVDICANYMDFISYCVYNSSGEQIMATSQSHLQVVTTEYHLLW